MAETTFTLAPSVHTPLAPGEIPLDSIGEVNITPEMAIRIQQNVEIFGFLDSSFKSLRNRGINTILDAMTAFRPLLDSLPPASKTYGELEAAYRIVTQLNTFLTTTNDTYRTSALRQQIEILERGKYRDFNVLALVLACKILLGRDPFAVTIARSPLENIENAANNMASGGGGGGVANIEIATGGGGGGGDGEEDVPATDEIAAAQIVENSSSKKRFGLKSLLGAAIIAGLAVSGSERKNSLHIDPLLGKPMSRMGPGGLAQSTLPYMHGAVGPAVRLNLAGLNFANMSGSAAQPFQLNLAGGPSLVSEYAPPTGNMVITGKAAGTRKANMSKLVFRPGVGWINKLTGEKVKLVRNGNGNWTYETEISGMNNLKPGEGKPSVALNMGNWNSVDQGTNSTVSSTQMTLMMDQVQGKGQGQGQGTVATASSGSMQIGNWYQPAVELNNTQVQTNALLPGETQNQNTGEGSKQVDLPRKRGLRGMVGLQNVSSPSTYGPKALLKLVVPYIPMAALAIWTAAEHFSWLFSPGRMRMRQRLFVGGVAGVPAGAPGVGLGRGAGWRPGIMGGRRLRRKTVRRSKYRR